MEDESRFIGVSQAQREEGARAGHAMGIPARAMEGEIAASRQGGETCTQESRQGQKHAVEVSAIWNVVLRTISRPE